MSGMGWKLDSESVLMTPWVLGWAMVSVSVLECKMVSEMVWHCQYEMTLKMETLRLLLRKTRKRTDVSEWKDKAEGRNEMRGLLDEQQGLMPSAGPACKTL